MNEQVDLYIKLFQSEGWDENSAHELTRYIVNKLDNNEKETLDEDINLDEISKVIKILNQINPQEKMVLFQNFINFFGKI
jgi:hypothetical protein